MSRELTKIPRLKFKTDRIATAAEVGGCYCFTSDIPTTEFCSNNLNTLIVTRNNGYLIIPHEELQTLVSELQATLDDLERIKRVVS